MNYSGISECDVLNGTGFRTVIFVSGCDHKCRGCHNSKTWNPNYGYKFTEETKKYILECLSKSYIDGITISGGDPLYTNNLDDILNLIQEIRHLFGNTKTIWLYTGYTWKILNAVTFTLFAPSPEIEKYIQDEKKRQEILSYVDVLVDGRYEEDKRDITLKFRGSSNQKCIDVQKSLEQGNIVLHCD